MAADAGEDGNGVEGLGVEGLLRIAEELRALAREHNPPRRKNMPAACEKLKQRIAALARQPAAGQAIEQAVAVFNGRREYPKALARSIACWSSMAYRLAFWRVAASDINYRRFFDIDGLAGVRIEEPEVFQRMHGLVFDLVRRGLVQGLRIDHIDGLPAPKPMSKISSVNWAPTSILWRKKSWAPARNFGIGLSPEPPAMKCSTPLTASSSMLRPRPPFKSLYTKFTGEPHSYEAALQAAKSQVLRESFASELESLVSDMKRIADANRSTRDYSVNIISVALADIINAFPVYRTYITLASFVSEDLALVTSAVRKAGRDHVTRPQRS